MKSEIWVLTFGFVLLLCLNVPIAVAIGIATVLTILVAGDLPALILVAQRMATGLDSFALLAIPFFILSGQLMGRGGIARRLVEFAKVVVGPFPGGLAYVDVLACMLFGSVSGSAVAATSAIGGFMLPMMNKEGYDKNYSASVNITASTTGLIIPPSNLLIVYSLASGGISIAALFLAGYLPGILTGLSIMVVAGIIAYRREYKATGAVPIGEAVRRFAEAIPSLLLVVIVIGGIVAGIFTPTEAAAIAVVYSLILSAVIYREVKWKELPDILLRSVLTTAVVMLLIATSMAMSWIFAYEYIPQSASQALVLLTDSRVLVLMMINAILLAVGTFMDSTPAVLIFTPIFLPVVTKLGVDPIHFGMIMTLNLCLGLCTPPVGTVLFVGCGIADTTISKVAKPLLPFFIAMIVTLLLVTYMPALSLFIPHRLGFK